MAVDDVNGRKAVKRTRSAILNAVRPLSVRRKVVRHRRASSLLDRANRYLVGGVDSPVRAFHHVGGRPIVIKRGAGAWVTDVSGHRYLDLIMGWGALILGHRHAQVLKAVRHQLSRGTLLGLTTELEGQLAQAISEAMPFIERVRFTPSGTEACMTAIRLSRAWTKRTKILSFEGCYHGHSDGLLVKSAGVPSSVAQETIVIPYNDVTALEEAVARFGGEMACAILEPVAANMGVVIPDPAFLQRLRAMTATRGIILIVDEVVTGFRLRYGGHQKAFGIAPDLTVLGKIIGGGFPIGAVGGRADIMEQLAPEGAVYHAGTFAGHPVTMAAGLATLKVLGQQNPYERLEAMGDQLASGLREAARQQGVAVQVNQIGSMLTVFFENAKQFAAFANGLRRSGVLIPPSPFEAWFLSTAHTAAQVEHIIEAARKIYGQL